MGDTLVIRHLEYFRREIKIKFDEVRCMTYRKFSSFLSNFYRTKDRIDTITTLGKLVFKIL